jgi:hypothetical protein
MRKAIIASWFLACAGLMVAAGLSGVQTPAPPSPTPIVVTATPSVPPEPPTF